MPNGLGVTKMLAQVKDIPVKPIKGICYMVCNNKVIPIEIGFGGWFPDAKTGEIIDVSDQDWAPEHFEDYEALCIRMKAHRESNQTHQFSLRRYYRQVCRLFRRMF